MREMRVVGIRIERAANEDRPAPGHPVLLLGEIDGERRLPIGIEPAEATAIVPEQEGVVPVKPSTHDLITNLIGAFERTLLEIRITDLRDGSFDADLVFDHGVRLAARPADAVAVALRVACPIYVDERTLDEAGVVVSAAEEAAAIQAHDVRPGNLLVAAPDLTEPEFRQSVLYVVEHNETGSLGVVLDRPSHTAVPEVLPQWAELTAPPDRLFVGGPVKRDAALCLALLHEGAEIDDIPGLRRIDGRIAVLDLDTDPAQVASVVETLRIFAGYATWLPRALTAEVARGDWIVRDASSEDPVTAGYSDLWTRAFDHEDSEADPDEVTAT